MRNRGKRYVILAVVSILAVLLVAIGPFMALPALAQSEPTGFTNVTLSIYPEYDNSAGVKPSLLVMLDGQIKGAVAPTTVRFLVPQKAVMYSAGSGPRDKYQGGPPNRKASDIAGWDEISYTLKTDTFVVEYYVPIPSVPDKSFSSVFIPLYPISGLTVLVQEPRQSSNFVVTTDSNYVSRQDGQSQGFKVHEYSYSSLDSGQQLGFSLSYTKSNPAPSLEIRESSNTGIIVLGVLAGAFVVGFLVYVMRRKPTYDRRSRKKVVAAAQKRRQPGARFCAECGAKLDKAVRFCKECGAQVGKS